MLAQDLPPMCIYKIAVQHGLLVQAKGSKMLSGHIKFQVKDNQSFLVHQTPKFLGQPQCSKCVNNLFSSCAVAV